MQTSLIIAGTVLVALLVLGLILTRLYRRATKDIALVRTGIGGERIVTNGGCMVLPVFHELQDVSLKTAKLEVKRQGSDALITKDKIRVDVTGLFHIRVSQTVDGIAKAAQTLGSRINDPHALTELVEGKLVSALRSVAATMDMDELHANREEFIRGVRTSLENDLPTNGLELEGVSLTHFDQTDTQFLNPNNAFDAVGLTKITETIEQRKKERNDIEALNRVAIEKRNFEANKESLSIKQADEFNVLEQEREVENRRAATQAEIAAKAAEARRSSEIADVEAAQAIDERKIAQRRELAIAAQEEQIAVNTKSMEESQARAKADEARAEAVKAEELVKTEQETAVAERERRIEVIEATKNAEREAVHIKVAAEAERDAATNHAEAARLTAQGEADAEKLRAEAAEVTFKVNAYGEESMNTAKNLLSGEQVDLAKKLATIAAMPSIIEQSVKPIEAIDNIKIIDIRGLGTNGSELSSADLSGTSVGGGDNLANQAVSAAMRYRVQAPILDQLTQEVFGNQTALGSLSAMVNAVNGDATAETKPTVEAKPDFADIAKNVNIDEVVREVVENAQKGDDDYEATA